MIFIGIAGPSGAGKTTLAHYLAANYKEDFEHIRQDDYLRDPREFPMVGEFKNWEHPSNYSFDILYNHLKQLQQGREVLSRNFVWRDNDMPHEFYLKPKKYILVEGSLIMINEDVASMFDKKIYLDVPTNVMLERRAKRMGENYHADYDLKVTLPEFERHGMIQKMYTQHIVDATRDKNEVAATVKQIIENT